MSTDPQRGHATGHASASPDPAAGEGGGLRLLAAALLLPWLLVYGTSGVWAIARGARAWAQHVPHVDAGYVRPVSPGGLVTVGALLVAAFAVLLAAALLVLTASRRRGPWIAVLVSAAVLTAGAVWAGLAGRMHPGLWSLLFFGLVAAAVLAVVAVARMPRAADHVRITGP